MTVGHYHGYPLLRLRPGASIAEGYRAWRTFTRDADDAMLGLAADAARTIWSDDPMTRDLIYVEPDENADDAACRNADSVCQDQQHDHFDFDAFFADSRAGQEDAYLEQGASVEAA